MIICGPLSPLITLLFSGINNYAKKSYCPLLLTKMWEKIVGPTFGFNSYLAADDFIIKQIFKFYIIKFFLEEFSRRKVQLITSTIHLKWYIFIHPITYTNNTLLNQRTTILFKVFDWTSESQLHVVLKSLLV